MAFHKTWISILTKTNQIAWIYWRLLLYHWLITLEMINVPYLLKTCAGAMISGVLDHW